MSSSVFYRFRSMREPKTITFDGTGITVYDLKREILQQEGLADGASNIDFHIYDESNPKDEYNDDTVIISRSSSVIASRVPARQGPGKGRATRYISGKAPVAARNSSRMEQSRGNEARKITPPPVAFDPSVPMSDADRLKAMFAAESAQWEAQQSQLANQKAVFYKGPINRKHVNSDKPLPPGYICHRCQEKGHWIQDCPTNDDPNFVAKPRLKRTTGIPKTFIKRIEKPEGDEEALAEDLASGKIMLDAAGNYVTVEADHASWTKFEEKHKANQAAQAEAATGDSKNKELQELGLLCPIDQRLFVDPMKTPCCGKTYCNDCIESALSDTDLACPNCGETVLIDDLTADEETLAKIKTYQSEKAKSPQNQSPVPEDKVNQNEPTGTDKAATPNGTSTGDKSASPAIVKAATAVPSNLKVNNAVGSPKSTTSNTSSASKKRSAEDEPDILNAPKGPAAQNINNNHNQMPFMNGMNGMNNMMPMMPNMMNGMGMPMMSNMMNGMGGMGMPMGMGMNGMMPGMMMPGMPMGGGMPNMFGMNNMNHMNGMNNNGNMNGMSWQGMPPNQPHNQTHNQNFPNNNHFNNNNFNANNGFGPNYRQFNQQPANTQDSAYSRVPVNNQRNLQNRNKKARPSDYKSLV